VLNAEVRGVSVIMKEGGFLRVKSKIWKTKISRNPEGFPVEE
jgi:hypothetical protein